MEMPFGLYPRFYVKRKDQLFPLLEKYTGEKITDKTPHGKVIPIYYRLLKSNEAFRAEVDALIEGQASKLLTAQQKVALKQAEKEGIQKGTTVESNMHGSGNYANAGGLIFGSIATAVGSIFGTVKASKEADAASDAAFYEVVLNEQKNDDTMKILVVTGITLAFVGLGVYLVLKLRK
jgi:hypothetical protein